jgi:hypothetical protein
VIPQFNSSFVYYIFVRYWTLSTPYKHPTNPISKKGGSGTWSHDMLNIMESIFETPSPTLDV